MKTKPMKTKTTKTKNRVIEKMYRCELKNFIVRHWIDIDNIDYIKLHAVLDDHSDDIPGTGSLIDILQAIELVPGITAVEVLEKDTGNGYVVYPDWH